MIKFAIERKDSKIALGLGLSRRNLEFLLQGRPMAIELEPLGLASDKLHAVLIVAGETEGDIVNQLIEQKAPGCTVTVGPDFDVAKLRQDEKRS